MKTIVCCLLLLASGDYFTSKELNELLTLFIQQLHHNSDEVKMHFIDVSYSESDDLIFLDLTDAPWWDYKRGKPVLQDMPLFLSDDDEIRRHKLKLRKKSTRIKYDYCYQGYYIRLIGPPNSFFRNSLNNSSLPVDDVDNWQVAFFRDGSINKYLSYKTNFSADISDIESIFPKADSSIEEEWIQSYIFRDFEVDHAPEYLPGTSCLTDTLMRRLSHLTEEDFHLELGSTITFSFLVNRQGKTSQLNVESTGNTKLDQEIERVALSVCNDGFAPAIHRGEIINCRCWISILKRQLLRERYD
ncbi:MAG: hypothetical protein IJ202_08305 [Bacteroidales bacterium]|nr:hypothetical protein [Bacteroidales bacterium]